MQFYELPGMLINPEHIVIANVANEKGYILHSVAGGEYHLSPEQTEAFKKLVEKDGKLQTLSLRKKAGDAPDVVEGDHAPANETFVPPIVENHPLNDIPGSPPPNQAIDLSISEPRVESPVIDASDNAPAAKAEAKAESKAAKPLTNADVKGDSDSKDSNKK